MMNMLLIDNTGNGFYDFFINIINFFVDPSVELSTLQRIFLAIIYIVVSHFIIKLICFVLKKALKIDKKMGLDISFKSFIVTLIRISLYIFLAFLVAFILKIDIGSFAGVLSAVTVAIGLAVQDVIGAFASGILLISEKCFKPGDHIEIVNSYGVCEGEVQKVGLILTRIKTFNGEMIFLANNTVTKANMTNFTYFETRRLVVDVPLSFDSDIDKAKEVIYEVLKNDSRIFNDPKPVASIDDFKEFSMKMVVRMWTKNKDYWDVYFDIREAILKALKENSINLPSINTITITKN